MSDYAENGTLVLQAGRRVLQSLDEDEDDRRFAINQLVRAADQATASGYQSFAFQPSRSATVAPTEVHTADDVLASVLVDVSAANVVVAAGQAIDSGTGDPRQLQTALSALEQTNALLRTSGQSTQFGFKANAAPRPKTASADVQAARKSFDEAAARTLERIVATAESTVTEVMKALLQLDPSKVAEALGSVGQRLSGFAAAAGRLIRKGVELLENAINRLVDRLGSAALARVREWLEGRWEDLKSGTHTRRALVAMFGTDATRSAVATSLAQPALTLGNVDSGTDAINDLADRYDSNMELVRGILKAVAIGLGLLAFTPIAMPTVALGGAAAYLTLLAAVVLIGMDFTDSGTTLGWVDGVGSIATRLG